MTDEQFKQLRSLITMISDRVDQIEMHLRRQDETAAHRHSLLYEWCAPAEYKAAVDAIGDVQAAEIPDDIKKLLDL